MAKLQQTIVPLTQSINLEDTLMSGQCFSWTYHPSSCQWRGWMAGQRCTVEAGPSSAQLLVSGASAPQIHRYFSLELDQVRVESSFPDDGPLRNAVDQLPGLRLVRDDPWECMVNFLCSSQKQIPQIVLLNHRLRTHLSEKGQDTFPEPEKIYRVGEPVLRRYRLGYRARFVYAVAKAIHLKQWSWARLDDLSTDEASDYLCRLPGIGPKIAHCILLYGLHRLDAFPVDVWMSRIVHRLYFSKKKQPPATPQLLDFARDHFGPYCGYAQLFLFHAVRKGLIPLD
jgi:N-glycosylase/DNA lyase